MIQDMGPTALSYEDSECFQHRSHRHQSRYLERDYLRARPIKFLEWVAHGHLFRLAVDARKHLTDESERGHYADFVMPFETELDVEEFARDPTYDLFIGQPRLFNGSCPARRDALQAMRKEQTIPDREADE